MLIKHYIESAMLLGACMLLGCTARPETMPTTDLSRYLDIARDTVPVAAAASDDWNTAEVPRTLLEKPPGPENYWPMTVEEAIHTAVTRSTVLRDLNGTIVRTPIAVGTSLDPAVVETDPRIGVHAALSAFDATYAASVIAEKNDRALNNLFTAGGTRIFMQDLLTAQQQISKRGAAGTQMTMRQNIDYDANNALANLFPSAWNTNLEAEVRQPLLQGAGAQFNRIAGPGNLPGVYNGVVIARANEDISLAEFELNLQNLVSNVENAYWDLYFAYRDLDSKVAARDSALNLWRNITAQKGRELGKAEREAYAREEYYRFEEEAQNALAGRPGDGTSNYNGTTGGAFRGTGGVLYFERRLRLLIGIELRNDQLIRPADEPSPVHVAFDWNEISAEALVRRPELRRQRIQLRRREMELVAARNFLLPQFDVIGRYRWRGFGEGLIDAGRRPDAPFDNAFQNLTSGDFQEWQLGGELKLPIGYRMGHTAVRNAQLFLVRERAILDEQERQILYDLSNAYAELDRAYQVLSTTYNRRMAAKHNVDVLRDRLQWDPQFSVDQLLDAERRFTDADIRFHRASVEHALAVKNVHREKGTLLDYGQVYLAEEESPQLEIRERALKSRLQGQGDSLNYVMPEKPRSEPPVEPPYPAPSAEPPYPTTPVEPPYPAPSAEPPIPPPLAEPPMINQDWPQANQQPPGQQPLYQQPTASRFTASDLPEPQLR